nr:beta-carotene hydroxylase [Cyanidioschyzonaceae sp. 2]
MNSILFFISVSFTLASIVLYSMHMPLSICFVLNVVSLHLAGSLIHDASHKSAHANHMINALIGHVCGFLLGFSFVVFTRVHMQHHAHVNHSQHDPDHYVSTAGPIWLIAPRFFYHEIYFFQRRLYRGNELWQWLIARSLFLLVLLLAWKLGAFSYVLRCWFCAALLVGTILGVCFDYLPHYPFINTHRWQNACLVDSHILNYLILGQNYHLVHHLWPSEPWHNYARMYKQNEALFTEQTSILGWPNQVWYDLLFGLRIS